jgi:translation initiation factor IF-2
MMDERGEYVTEAGPSTPVEILGFSDVPEAGDLFIVVDEKKAKQTGQYWQQKKREEDLRKDARISLENFFNTSAEQEKKNLRIIIKADVQGSLEALKQSLENLSTDEVEIRVIHSSVGAVSLNDVMLASASDAVIIGFNVKTEPKVYDAAEKEKVDIRIYGIIYEIVDDVKKAMAGMLEPKYEEKTTGRAEVRQMFQISKLGTVAGCFINEGKMVNGSHARVIRNGDVVHKGKITSLKRFKEDVKEAQSGQECGIFLGNYKEFEEGDIIESFVLEQVARTL